MRGNKEPNQPTKRVVGVTMGDVNGIGPELILKTFSDSRILKQATVILYGSGKALYYYRNTLKVERFNYQTIQEPNHAHPGRLNFIECSPRFEKVEIGVPAEASGLAAYQALEKAVHHLKEGFLDALVTLPINKATIQNDHFQFPGHTEYLAARFGVNENLMLMLHEDLRIGVVTGHIPLNQVAKSVTAEKIYLKLRLMNDTLRVDFNISKPRIAVLALNPHAGDGGLIGQEDQEVVSKGINRATKENLLVLGPYAADSFFATSLYRRFDGILAMYHDQGLIPFKTLAQGQGVNYTAGLPVIRTSPDHGTAYDIAGANKADPTSFRQAFFEAIDIAQRRSDNQTLFETALRDVAVNDLFSGEDAVLAEES